MLTPDPGDGALDQRRFLDRHFPYLGPQHRALGEGSVSLLYASWAVPRVLRAFPSARFVVGVRNPVDLVHSYHARMVYMTEEDEPDLAVAWALQGERAAGRRLPRGCREPRLLQYRELGRLGTHLERFGVAAGLDRVLVYLFDDLIRDPGRVYAEVLRWAELPDDGRRSSLPRKAGHRAYRHHWLQELAVGKIGRPAPALIALYQRNSVWIRPVLRPVRRWLKARNTRRAERPGLEPALRAELAAAFAPEVDLLERITGRDLSAWRQDRLSIGALPDIGRELRPLR